MPKDNAGSLQGTLEFVSLFDLFSKVIPRRQAHVVDMFVVSRPAKKVSTTHAHKKYTESQPFWPFWV